MNKHDTKISVIGLGYIGLPTAAIFASKGANVVGVDIDERIVNSTNRGELTIVEPGLGEIVREVVAVGKLRASLTVETADVFVIAVPTPMRDNKEPDLSYIEAACDSISPVLKKGDMVILESTSPVGTTEMVSKRIGQKRLDLNCPGDNVDSPDVFIAHCPERVLPGNIIHEIINNPRIVGGITVSCTEKAVNLYVLLLGCEVISTTVRTAELCKLAENSFRDVNIAFANELSMICRKLHVDVDEVRKLANKHPRVNILKPGPGVGGHCIAIDPWFIVSSAPKESRLIRTAREVNIAKVNWVIDDLQKYLDHLGFNNKSNDCTVAFYGLAFKPNIDDLRESPALEIVSKFGAKFPGKVLAVEPNIKQSEYPNLGFDLVDIPESIERATLNVLLVQHDEFQSIDFKNKVVSYV